jgi:hypothetical protein
MKSKLSAAAVVAVTSFLAGGMILSSPVSARADAVLVGTPTDATGVTGLVVDGNTYNVSFIHDSYNNVFPSNDPIFAGNSTLAFDAGAALATALNTLSVTGILGFMPGIQQFLLIPTTISSGGLFDTRVVDFNTTFNRWICCGMNTGFSVDAVPVGG